MEYMQYKLKKIRQQFIFAVLFLKNYLNRFILQESFFLYPKIDLLPVYKNKYRL